MKNLKTTVLVGIGIATLAGIAAILLGPTPAVALGGLLALTVPPTLAARNTGGQQVLNFRYRLQAQQIAALTNGVKIGRLPSRAFVLSASIHIVTAFNSATTDTIQLGSTNGASDIMATGSGNLHAAAYILNNTSAALAGIGLAVTGAGEVDIWAKYAQSGAAATAGDATLVLNYICDNDQ